METEVANALTQALSMSPSDMAVAKAQHHGLGLLIELMFLLVGLGFLWADKIGKWPNWCSRWLYSYGDDLAHQANRLKSGLVDDAIERAAIVQALARVNAARCLGTALMFAVVLLP